MTEKEQEDIRDNISEEEISQKDTDTLIMENGKTFDVYDLLEENKSDPVVIKINNLIKEGGITAEIVAEKYSEVAGGIEDKELALMALDSVFIDLALSITAKPNGIVIDLSTGLKDDELSRLQEVELGIDTDDYSSPNSSKEAIAQLSIQRSLEKYREARNEKLKNNVDYTIDSQIDSRHKSGNFYSDKELKKDLERLVRYNDKAKREITEAKRNVIETDDSFIMLINLINKTNDSKGTPSFNISLQNLQKFLEANPKSREAYFEVTDENREIKPEYKAKAEQYKDDLSQTYLIRNTKIPPEWLAAMPEDTRKIAKKEIIMSFVASFRKLSFKNEARSNMLEDVIKLIPEIGETIDEQGKFDTDKLRDVLTEQLELTKPLTPKNFKSLMEGCQEHFLNKYFREQERERHLKLRQEGKIPDSDIDLSFDKMGVEMTVDIDAILNQKPKKTNEEKYFEGSEIVNFSKRNQTALKETYKKFNSISWISEKSEAIELSFLSLMSLKDTLGKVEKYGKYYTDKVTAIQEKIDKLKQEHKDIDFDSYLNSDGKLTEESSDKIKKYQDAKVNEKVIYDFITDENGVTTHDDYENLSKKDKQEYIFNTIVALNSGSKDMKNTIGKFCARRFEILNTEGNEIISLVENEDGTKSPKINKEKIVEEYNKTSSHKFTSYKELMAYTEVKRKEYISTKLEEYAGLREEDFFKLNGKSDAERSSEIERIRMDFNLHQRDTSNVGEGKNNSLNNKERLKEQIDTLSQKIDKKLEKRNVEVTSENNSQKSLMLTEKPPSFLDKLKSVFSMLTNLTARAKSVFTNNQNEAPEEGVPYNIESEKVEMKKVDFPTFKKVDVNVLEAVAKTEQSKTISNSRQNENQMEMGD